ncbi:hypothetical protein [Psychromonas sp. SA13A]|uniref:hypothetical protein n=1 Tax=Psychromonas sp. SA13A TaxID=2686346 RepID=UPI00140DA983|nr:hypothetical protein [Psychromonas sp. SA13A]
MKELIIHAGMPKNGSSALQVMFAKNYNALKKLSLDYFKMGDFDAGLKGAITSGNGALLSRSLLGEKHEAYLNDPDKKHLKELLRLVKNSDSDIGIVSSEFFTNIPTPSIELLKQACSKIGVTVKYFYYVRRQDQFLMSGYMQRVKRHHCIEYPEKFVQESYKNVGFLNYYSFSEAIAKVLGKENVIVRNFDICKKHPKGLAIDFIETLGCDISDFSIPNDVVNISPTPLEIKTLLVLNKYKPNLSLTDGIVRDSILYGRGRLATQHSILKPALCKEVLDFFSNQNNRLNQGFLGKGQQLDLAINDSSYIDLEKLELSTMELLDIVGSILVRMDKK